MRLLLTALILAATSQAFAQEVEMKYGGEFRVRYNNLENTTAQDVNSNGQNSNDSNIDHRFKLNLTARKGESIQAGLTLLHASGWGRDNAGTVTGIPSSRDQAGAENQLFVNRAWGWWKANDSIAFKFGRVGLEIADGSVFSENDWEQFPVSHDGVLALWDISLGKFTFFAIKNRELGQGYLTADAEANMYGFAFDFKNIPAVIKMMNFHFLQLTQDQTGTAALSTGDNRQHFGATIGGDYYGFIYKASGAYQLGKTNGTAAGTPYSGNNNAWMMDFLGGYQASSLLNVKLTGNYHQDTGSKDTTDLTKNEAYNPLFYDRHNYAGLMDVLRWGNLSYWDANLSMTPTDDLDVGISYLKFSRSTIGANTGSTNFGPNYSLNLDKTVRNIGSEIDAWVNKVYSSSGFQIGGRFGVFFPGDALKADSGATPRREKDIYQLLLQGSLSF